jgi:hypothetical protein
MGSDRVGAAPAKAKHDFSIPRVQEALTELI